MVPELADSGGNLDVAAAQLLMELVAAKGPDWTLMEWMGGRLDVLLSAGRRLAQAQKALTEVEATIAAQERNLAFLQGRHETLMRVEQGGWWRMRSRLQPALRLYGQLRGRREA